MLPLANGRLTQRHVIAAYAQLTQDGAELKIGTAQHRLLARFGEELEVYLSGDGELYGPRTMSGSARITPGMLSATQEQFVARQIAYLSGHPLR